MRPSLRQLEYIVAVHQLGSFSLAADTLHISQPSLSTQIAAVETDFGVKLFKRGRGGAQATAKGLEFVHRARRILAEVENLRSIMTSALPFGGRLRLGVLPSIGPYLLPQVMLSLHRDQPDLRAALPAVDDPAGTPVYVIDPNGFVIMRYAPGFDMAGLRKDLATLLKLK